MDCREELSKQQNLLDKSEGVQLIMNIVIINCFDTWEHRTDLLYRIMTEAGHKVEVLCSDYRHMDKKRRLEGKKGYIFFSAEPYLRNISAARLRSHMRLSKDMFCYVRKHITQIDLMWVLAPPNSFVRDAAAVRKRYPEKILIIDLMDLWPETMPVRFFKKLPLYGFWKGLRNENLRYADMVVTECNLYKKELSAAAGGMKAETLYLAREDKGYHPALNLPDGRLSLCYLGSMNHIIDIRVIAEIIRSCAGKQPVILHMIGDGERKHALVKAAKKAGAEVVWHGRVYDRKKKQRIFDSCHYGLNIMKETVCVGLTMKSIDYFEFGLPIINNISGDTWDAVSEYGIGVNWNGSLKTDICHLDMRIKARKFFEAYLTEAAFAKRLKDIFHSSSIFSKKGWFRI